MAENEFGAISLLLTETPILGGSRSTANAASSSSRFLSEDTFPSAKLMCVSLPSMVVPFRFLCLYSGAVNMHRIGRKFAAVAALLALLLPGFSALAENLSAANVSSCCGTAYCPIHHRPARNLQKDKSDCDSMGNPGNGDCSVSACDVEQSPAVGTPLFILVAPVTLSVPAPVEFAPSTVALFSPYAVIIPLTPPPRIIPS